jgi:C4-dicarboxylate-binding protein DctP
MTFLKRALLCAAILASPNIAAASCEPGEMVIRFAHVTNTDRHPKGIAAALLEKRVNEEMNGKACMIVYPGGSLYDDDKVLQAMLHGDVQLAAPSLSKLETFTKKFRIFDLPFLFKSIDAVDAFINSPDGSDLKNSMSRRGLVGLSFWHNGMRQISANKPLVFPTDAEGLTFRVQSSDVLAAQMRAIGASAKPMSFSKVFAALRDGVVDAQVNTWSNIFGQKFYEVQDGVTETNHSSLSYLVVAPANWLRTMDPAIRSQFLQLVDEVTVLRNKEAYEVNQQAKQGIIDAGGVIRQLTDAQRTAWINAMSPVWDQFADDVGLEKIKAAQAINAQF